MTDLSPAAQAVLTAQAKERCLFEWSALNDPPCRPSDADWNGCVQCVDRGGLAAAFRALADRMTALIPDVHSRGFARGVEAAAAFTEAIAAELEAEVDG